MAQLLTLHLETLGIWFSGIARDGEIVTQKADGKVDRKQVQFTAISEQPLHNPGAAVPSVCSQGEPMKAKLGSALCSSSEPVERGCAVRGCSY